MTLHLQTRAYPLNHRGVDPAGATHVSGDRLGHLALTRGRLGSLAYGQQSTVDLDLTPAYGAVPLPEGVSLQWVRMRVLDPGVALVTVAVLHAEDLAALDALTLDARDAAVNRCVKQGEIELVDDVVAALAAAGVVDDLRPRFPGGQARESGLLDACAVRYNCHFVTAAPPWRAHARVRSEEGDLAGSGCHLLLPYTYAWALAADAPVDELLVVLEPADVAVAQRAVLAGAQGDAMAMLDRLSSRERAGTAAPGELRRHVDRIRLTYQRLDSYRYDSAQQPRGVYLAACREMGLPTIHEQTEYVLGRVMESLRAEAGARSAVLDARLNRTAAVLAVATGGLFVFDLIGFAPGGQDLSEGWRLLVIAVVLLVSGAAVTWLFWKSARSSDAG